MTKSFHVQQGSSLFLTPAPKIVSCVLCRSTLGDTGPHRCYKGSGFTGTGSFATNAHHSTMGHFDLFQIWTRMEEVGRLVPKIPGKPTLSCHGILCSVIFQWPGFTGLQIRHPHHRTTHDLLHSVVFITPLSTIHTIYSHLAHVLGFFGPVSPRLGTNNDYGKFVSQYVSSAPALFRSVRTLSTIGNIRGERFKISVPKKI